MPLSKVADFLLFEDLYFTGFRSNLKWQSTIHCTKESKGEVCIRCASFCTTIYDHRTVTVRDTPLRGKDILLRIKKRRFYCKRCKKPFTEPVAGIMPKRRTTQRFRRSILWAAENFCDLKRVRKAYRCSNDFIYTAVYEQLELRRRMTNSYPWPSRIGLDEHNFQSTKHGRRQFVSMVVDQDNKKLREVVLGKSQEDLWLSLQDIPGRDNVRLVAIDLADSYKSFVQNFFPNAEIVADKFHVLRLLTAAINRRRKEITGDKRSNPVRKLLLRNRFTLSYTEKFALDMWLKEHPVLNEVYWAKEALHTFYRTTSYNKASTALEYFLGRLKQTELPELKTLYRTLTKWKAQILNYFKYRLTNARTEGFNNVAKLVKRRGYGFRSFKNYRLRLLSACS